ncbi:MAG TPA: response regulator [Candidatus Acidoferrum sp.]|nr:response regulator [Candidatus Acidoferrum sp.]
MKSGTLEEFGTLEITTPLRVLIVEHTRNDVELILLELKEAGLRVNHTVVENREQFRRALQQESFDAILSDYRLPNWTGLDALQELRETGQDIPFLLVTGTLGEEAAVECIKQGATDYILKDRISRLPVALKRAIGEKALRNDAKQTQNALAESETRGRQQFAELDLLYRSLPVALAVFDCNMRFLRVNDEVSKFDGVPAASHVGLTLREVAPDLANAAEGYLRRVFQTGESISNVELHGGTLQAPDAVRKWLCGFYPLRAEDGTVSTAAVMAIDITDRKLTQEALDRSEERNRDLVEHSIYGISRVGADGAFLDANPAFLSILGCTTAEELHALNLMRDVFRFPEQHAELMASCREHGGVHGAESDWRRRDGGIVAVRLHVRMLSIPNHAGAIEIIAEDVTELRAMERQLRQAQKFEAIGQLAGGIAHDFNNVVGAILGWAELGFEQNRATPQIADRFARIREQAERAAALTRELLAFARRQVLQPRAVDINAVTSGLVSFLDKVIARDIELKVITAAVDAVKADPTQLEQVLMNLCLNARDAMPSGGRLLIETEMVELDDSYCRFYPYVTPGRYAVLSVSDTGTGMDSETRERIFEPFFTTKANGKGTGMGLATAYGIVKQHGGFIHVYSEPGQGSLFRVYLPAHEGMVAEGSSAKAPAPALVEMRGSETILIAEDHESIREMARQTLMNLGYRVLSACDGEEALRLCEKEAPSLAILDAIMPKLGGAAAASKLTTLFVGLPILFTSGYSQDSENVAPATADAHYLQKPYSPTTLGRVVREILDQAKKRKATI